MPAFAGCKADIAPGGSCSRNVTLDAAGAGVHAHSRITMKLKHNRIIPCLAAGVLAGAGVVFYPARVCAADAAVASGTAPVSASTTAGAGQGGAVDALTALQQLKLRIMDKLSGDKAAQPVEQNYAADLAAFDEIVAGGKNAKPEDLAEVLVAKSGLYFQVFNDYDNAAKVIAQIKRDYPQTEIAAHADEMLADLRQMQAKYLAQQTLAPGRVFPDFVAKSLDGKDVSLAQFRLRGVVVLVDFWATWCPPCVAEVPHLKAAYEKYHDRGFEIVGISLDKSEGALRDFIKARSIPWAQVFDGKGWESALAQKYGVDAIPTMYLLDGDGKIVGSNLGGMVLEDELEKLLKK